MEDRCVICGAVIPEGRQVCPNCEFTHKPFEKPTTAMEETRQAERAYLFGYDRGVNVAKEEIEFWKSRVVMGIKNVLTELKRTLTINNEENTEYFDYVYTLQTIDEIAKKYGVEIDEKE